MVTPEEARKLAHLMQEDYCSCLPAYKDRGMFDPQCQSCMTHDERHECANTLRDLASQVESLQADANRYREMVLNDHSALYESYINEMLMSPDTCGKEEFDAAIDAARKQS